MAEQEEPTSAVYRERARELRALAAKSNHKEHAAALIAMALQYERLAELPKGEQPH
jgi:hypothetical protein